MTSASRATAVTLLAALAVPGAASAAGTPVEVPGPVEKRIAADPECIDYDASHMQEARVSARLDEHDTLYLLPCFAGAYNVVYRVYVLDARYPDEVKASLFAGYSEEMGWTGKDYLINAEFDPAAGRLTAFEKGRGLGDCGSIPTYEWAGHGWRMLEYRYQGECDGSRMPQDWPAIYRHGQAENK